MKTETLNRYCYLLPSGHLQTYRRDGITNDNPLRESHDTTLWDNEYSVSKAAKAATTQAFNRLQREGRQARNDLTTAPPLPRQTAAQEARARALRSRAPFDTLYLNNTGHRWICTAPGAHIVRVIGKGYDRYRKVMYFEAIGNFAAAVIRYKGAARRVMMPDETDANGYPVIRFGD